MAYTKYSLTPANNTAGQLAYQNYEQERARQQQAIGAAPALAQADYQDINQLLQAGQLREGYTGQQLGADIQRFNFLQNQPQQNLQNYLSLVYGNPLGRVGQSTASGAADTSSWECRCKSPCRRAHRRVPARLWMAGFRWHRRAGSPSPHGRARSGSG